MIVVESVCRVDSSVSLTLSVFCHFLYLQLPWFQSDARFDGNVLRVVCRVVLPFVKTARLVTGNTMTQSPVSNQEQYTRFEHIFIYIEEELSVTEFARLPMANMDDQQRPTSHH